MAPTLTATVDTAAKTVLLTVTGASGTITVKRYVNSAPTNVRGTFANGRTIIDYDAPLNTELVYIATDSTGSSPQQTVEVASDISMLSTMNSPVLSAPVVVLADDNQRNVGASVPHKILGTNTPLVTVEPPAYRSGTYRFLARTVNDWLTLRQMGMTGGVLLLRSHCPEEYLDTSFIITEARVTIGWASLPPRTRIVEWDYQAVAPDTTPPQEFAWTWGDVPGEFATWADVPATVPTWADMATYIPEP